MKSFPVKKFYSCFFCVFLVVFVPFFSFSEEETKRTVITIDNAISTQYEKDKESGNDIILLTGNVKVSVSSGSSKNVISADSIHYDRTS